VAWLPFLAAKGAEDKVDSWPTAVGHALGKAGNNRPELAKALRDTPSDQRPGMIFLITNMPDKDLLALKADFLLSNVGLFEQGIASPLNVDGKIIGSVHEGNTQAYVVVRTRRKLDRLR